MPRNRLPPWHEEFVLNNQRAILIRPIRPEDAAPLQGVFPLLLPAELRDAMAGPGGELDEAAAATLCRPDPKTELVLVGAEPYAPGEAVIASLARARIVPHTRQARFTILLGRHVAGLGLGRHLVQKLVKWSRGRYLDRLYGDIPETNRPMLDLCASMGFTPSQEPGVPPGLVRLVLDLSGG